MSQLFCNNTKIIAGQKALESLTFELQQYDVKRPFLICDDMSYRLGNLAQLLKAFDGFDIRFHYICKEVGDIADVKQCEQLVKQFRTNDCDGIVALGRKSVVDTAKCIKLMLKDGISFVSTYDNTAISDYSIMNVPLFIVPTNYANGNEAQNYSRVYDTKNNKVYQLKSDFIRTTTVIIDDRMTDIAPPKAISSYGFYALSMATYAFLEGENKLYVRPYASSAIELIRDNFIPCILHNANKDYRTNLMTAVIISGLAFDGIGENIVSEISNVISDRYLVSFPNVFAIIFKHYFLMHQWNKENLQQLLLPVAGEDEYSQCNPVARAEKCMSTLKDLYNHISEIIDTNKSLKDLKVEKSHFASIAEAVISSHYKENDDEATYRFIVQLLERAYNE